MCETATESFECVRIFVHCHCDIFTRRKGEKTLPENILFKNEGNDKHGVSKIVAAC